MSIDAVFRCSDVERLVAAAAPDNTGSCHVLDKAGLKKHQPVTRFTETGRPILLMEHAITRDEWQAQLAPEPSYREVPRADLGMPAPPLRAPALPPRMTPTLSRPY